MVLISGGTGSGLADLVQESWRVLNASLLFKGIDIIPGRSSAAAVYQGKLLYNLAGRPGAVSLLFEVLIKPVLLNMQGAINQEPSWFESTLESSLDTIPNRRSLKRAEMVLLGPGKNQARPLQDWNTFAQKLPLILDLKAGQGKKGEVVRALLI